MWAGRMFYPQIMALYKDSISVIVADGDEVLQSSIRFVSSVFVNVSLQTRADLPLSAFGRDRSHTQLSIEKLRLNSNI